MGNDFTRFGQQPRNSGLSKEEVRRRWIIERNKKEEEERRMRALYEMQMADASSSAVAQGVMGYSQVSDQDVINFINAAGITSQLEIIALNYLVLNLKSQGLWDKLNVIYPFLGGTAYSCKWNLKDPQDLDTSFRLTFGGGITFDPLLGIVGNKVNAFADSKYSLARNAKFSDIGTISTSNIRTTINSIGNANDWGVFEGPRNPNYYAVYGMNQIWPGIYNYNLSYVIWFNPSGNNALSGQQRLASDLAPGQIANTQVSSWYPNGTIYGMTNPVNKVRTTYSGKIPSGLQDLGAWPTANPYNSIYLLGVHSASTGGLVYPSDCNISFWGIGSSFDGIQQQNIIKIATIFNNILGRPQII